MPKRSERTIASLNPLRPKCAALFSIFFLSFRILIFINSVLDSLYETLQIALLRFPPSHPFHAFHHTAFPGY